MKKRENKQPNRKVYIYVFLTEKYLNMYDDIIYQFSIELKIENIKK